MLLTTMRYDESICRQRRCVILLIATFLVCEKQTHRQDLAEGFFVDV